MYSGSNAWGNSVTFGKVITGTLNGGGIDISLATMNGTITVRQSETKASTPAAPRSRKPSARR